MHQSLHLPRELSTGARRAQPPRAPPSLQGHFCTRISPAQNKSGKAMVTNWQMMRDPPCKTRGEALITCGTQRFAKFEVCGWVKFVLHIVSNGTFGGYNGLQMASGVTSDIRSCLCDLNNRWSQVLLALQCFLSFVGKKRTCHSLTCYRR